MRKLLAALAVVTLTSCSVYPIPDDVSPVPTEEIVRNLRCEVRDAVFNEIKYALQQLDLRTNGVQRLNEIPPERILERENLIRVAMAPIHGPRVASKFLLYGGLTIAFAFEFNIKETNTVGGSADFLRTFTNGTFTLNATASLNKVRQGERTFASVETFRDLSELDCDARVIHRKNILYPITGKIGMDKVVHTFIWLSDPGPPVPVPASDQEFSGAEGPYRLGRGTDAEADGSAEQEAAFERAVVRTAQSTEEGGSSKGGKGGSSKGEASKGEAKGGSKGGSSKGGTSKGGTSKADGAGKASAKGSKGTGEGTTAGVVVTAGGVKVDPTMFTDTLTFTTTWQGGLNPHLKLTPVDNGFRLVEADLNVGASRTDLHKVTISLAFPDKRAFALTRSANMGTVMRLIRAQEQAADSARDQATLNLCIALAKKREQEFGTLRLAPPEQYCSVYAQPGVTR